MTEPHLTPLALSAWARYAAEVLQSRIGQAPAPSSPPSAPRAGVFVTLRVHDTGDLRGCIGRIFPQRISLAEDVADCAVLAATSDPRFSAVQPEELAGLDVEISLLSTPQPVADFAALDAQRYGVIVRSIEPKGRTGVLLPAIDGVDSVEEQMAIAMRKANIGVTERVTWERFWIQKASVPLIAPPLAQDVQ